MPWQLAVGLNILTNVAIALIQRSYSQSSRVPATLPPAISYILGVVPLGLVAGLLLPHHVVWSWWVGLLLVIEAASVALGSWLGFQAAKLLPVGIYQTISRFSGVVVIMLGWTLLNEGLSSFQIMGAIILFIGSLLAVWAPIKNAESIHRKIHVRAAILALAATSIFGVALATEKGILGHMQIGACLIFAWPAQAGAMLLLAAKDISRANLLKLRGHEIRWSAFMGLVNGAGGIVYVWALVKSDNISVVTALLALILPLSALGAYLLLHERENQKLMWLSLLISFSGLVVSSLH